MDIRRPVAAIMVGGAPSPGINAVVSAVTIAFQSHDAVVLGFYDGFANLRNGVGVQRQLKIKDVSSIHADAGSILRTSRCQLETELEVDNCLRVLQLHRVRYLVTIGGTRTSRSAYLLQEAAHKLKFKLSVCHVPKTIFNDLPMPVDCRTFGYETARNVGMEILQKFRMDARTLQHWYVITVAGRSAGHLTLGIGKAAAVTMAMIPEEFHGEHKATFEQLVDIVEGTMLKRLVMKKRYGVVLICEGVVNCLKPEEVKERWRSAEAGYDVLSYDIVKALRKRFEERKVLLNLRARYLGSVLRSSKPCGTDASLGRALGYAASRFLLNGGEASVVAMRGNFVCALPLTDMLDPDTGLCRIRRVDITRSAYQIGSHFMLKLTKEDLESKRFVKELASVSNESVDAVTQRLAYIACPTSIHSPFKVPLMESVQSLANLTVPSRNGDEAYFYGSPRVSPLAPETTVEIPSITISDPSRNVYEPTTDLSVSTPLGDPMKSPSPEGVVKAMSFKGVFEGGAIGSPPPGTSGRKVEESPKAESEPTEPLSAPVASDVSSSSSTPVTGSSMFAVNVQSPPVQTSTPSLSSTLTSPFLAKYGASPVKTGGKSVFSSSPSGIASTTGSSVRSWQTSGTSRKWSVPTSSSTTTQIGSGSAQGSGLFSSSGASTRASTFSSELAKKYPHLYQ